MNRADGTDVTARLLEIAQRTPASPAILAPGCATLTFAALAQHVHRSAAQLAAWGVRRGDVVAWANGDRVETAVALAALSASCTIAPLNAAGTFDVLRDLLVRLRPKAVVVPGDGDSVIRRAAREAGVTELTTVCPAGGAAGAFDLVVSRPTASIDVPSHVRTDWACLGATSGATGKPKIVPHGHRQILVTARATGERLQMHPADISGHLMPLHLAGGIRNAHFQALLNGAAVNVLPVADTDAFLAAVAAGEVTWTSASFTILRELLVRLEGGAPYQRGRLRYVRVASGRLEADEMDRLERALGVPVVTGLASSETGTTAQQRLPPAPRKRGSVGPPVESEVRLVDESGRVVGRGEVGEIQVRGPQLFDGYYDDPDLDAASFDDGWFRMGDLARFDEDGELFLVGRVKEVINRGGDKIAPLEIDAVLRAIPGVAEAATFGIPHPRLGEEVVAAVVLEAGTQLDADALLRHAREALGPNRAPRSVWFVDALPRTDGGKVRRAALASWVGYHATGEALAPPSMASGTPPLQVALAALWADVLGLGSVAPDVDFFALGGDAPRGELLLREVREAFGVDIPTEALRADAGTVAGMARRIDAFRHAVPSAAPQR